MPSDKSFLVDRLVVKNGPKRTRIKVVMRTIAGPITVGAVVNEMNGAEQDGEKMELRAHSNVIPYDSHLK